MSVNNILEGLKQKGRPYEIPDCSRYELPMAFKELGLVKGVEIGTYLADYTEALAQAGLEIYGVDPWALYRDYGNPRGQKRLDAQYQASLERLKPYPNAHLIRKTSMDALADFEDESLDFVYIDGNHSFKYVAEDLWEWSRKVKQGGVIAGHDWVLKASFSINGICHVKFVVQAFIESMGIQDFWVLGSHTPKGERHGGSHYDTFIDGDKKEVRDRWRSWMFFKTYKNWPYIINN